MVRGGAFAKMLKEQFEVQKRLVSENASEKLKTVRPPIYYDVPRAEQILSSDTSFSTKDTISCPEGFFGIDHPNTIWIVNLLKDTSELRLKKCLFSIRSRPLFESQKYYQLIDRPTYYFGDSCKLDKPLFKTHTMLYLNAFGIALYLKADAGAQCMALAKSGKNSLVSTLTPQYAAFVHDRDYDLTRFNYDFLCIKREYFEGLRHLAISGWNPCSTTLFTYRRKYYQFTVPFTDWLDVLRYLLQRNPTINVAQLVKKMFQLQYEINPSFNFSMKIMKEVGKVMMEAFELRELTRSNSTNTLRLGSYAGRKVLKDKEVPVPDEYATVFADKDGKQKPTLRPVVPNVMSYARRLLTYQYYFDNEHLFALPQIIRAVSCFRQYDFFTAGQTVKNSCESDTTGVHTVYLDPLIFQINYFLNLKSDGMYLRHKQWSCHAVSADTDGISEEERAWYYRFDTFNCLSLLSGLLQNCLIRNLSELTIENLCDIIIHILVDAELIEPFFRYSYYDTYFGLTSVINCVPNLMSKTVQRLLKKAPITLVSTYEIPALARLFTTSFWQLSSKVDVGQVPSNLDAMITFLLLKRRRISMKVEGPATGEAMSGASSVGAAGGITMFVRNYDDMLEISAADETADQPASETTRKQDEERHHVVHYRQMEIDARYSTVFPAYYDGLNKTLVNYDENKMLRDCIYETHAQRSLTHLRH